MTGWNSANGTLSPFHVRMLVLTIALLLMFAAIAWMAHRTWSQSTAVRGQVRAVHDNSVMFGDRVRDTVRILDAQLFLFALGADPGKWPEFLQTLNSLKQAFEDQSRLLDTESERRLLKKIHREITRFEASARAFAASSAVLPADSATAIQIRELSEHSNSLIDLGSQIATAHQASVNDVLADADREKANIQLSTYFALALMLCIGTGMAWVVYNDSIAPLHRKLQESRRRLEQQEKLVALGELSGMVAHEIRNPLTAVKARLYTLTKSLQEECSAAEDARLINDEIDRLDRIVNECLQFMRPPQPKFAPVDPNHLLGQVGDLIEPLCATSGVRIALEPSRAPRIRADRDLIAQVLINLVQNSVQAIEDTGVGNVTTLRAAAAHSGEPGKQRHGVRMEVIDDGPGIPPEKQPRLFDPFFTTKAGGTGLGLALSRRIIEKHSGTIDFSSPPGRQTTFAVWIPVFDE